MSVTALKRSTFRVRYVLGLMVTLSITMAQPASPALACLNPINLAAIDRALAKPDLTGDLLVQARKLRAAAAAEIENNHPAEGRRLYYQLMTLLGMPLSSGNLRC